MRLATIMTDHILRTVIDTGRKAQDAGHARACASSPKLQALLCKPYRDLPRPSFKQMANSKDFSGLKSVLWLDRI